MLLHLNISITNLNERQKYLNEINYFYLISLNSLNMKLISFKI